MSFCMMCSEENKLRYNRMELYVSENQRHKLPVDTCNSICTDEPGNVLTETEKGEERT